MTITQLKMVLLLIQLLLMMFIIINKIQHPLMLMVMMLIYFLNMFNLLVTMNNISFYPLLIFLIMIGGMMILILYFTSLTLNKFKLMTMKKINLKIVMQLMMFHMSSFLKIKNEYLTTKELYKASQLYFLNQINENVISPMKMFDKPMMTLLMIMILYILFTLTWIAKICMKFNFPLRKLNN